MENIILSRSESKMIRQVYDTQILSNSVGDWVRMVQADKAELGINLSDSEIQCVSKKVFHNHVKKKAHINMVNKM